MEDTTEMDLPGMRKERTPATPRPLDERVRRVEGLLADDSHGAGPSPDVLDSHVRLMRSTFHDLEDRASRLSSERDRLRDRTVKQERRIATLERRLDGDEDGKTGSVESLLRPEDVVRRADAAERALAAAHEEIEQLNHRLILLEKQGAVAGDAPQLPIASVNERERTLVRREEQVEALRTQLAGRAEELRAAKELIREQQDRVDALEQRLRRAKSQAADFREELDAARGRIGRGTVTTDHIAPPVTVEPVDDLPIFDGFNVERDVGVDLLGPVYHAREIESRRPVCIRALGRKFGGARRGRLDGLAHVRHANLFCVLEVSEHGDSGLYMVTERPAGETLEAWLERVGPLPERTAMAIAIQIARGLRQAAFHTVHHSDLAPGFVRVDAAGRVRVAGVGMSALAPPEERTIPFPEFASPERLRGSPPPGASGDIYSLGALIHAMLTGLPPYSGDAGAVLRAQSAESFPDLRRPRPEVSDATAQLVMKMGSRDPDRRFADWDQTIVALERISVPAAVASAAGARSIRTVRNHLLRWAASHPVAFATAACGPLLVLGAVLALLA